MPTYKIDGLGLEKPRVVEAGTPATARQHVASSLTVRKIEVSEAFALANDGVRLEKAGEVATIGDPNSLGGEEGSGEDA